MSDKQYVKKENSYCLVFKKKKRQAIKKLGQ